MHTESNSKTGSQAWEMLFVSFSTSETCVGVDSGTPLMLCTGSSTVDALVLGIELALGLWVSLGGGVVVVEISVLVVVLIELRALLISSLLKSCIFFST
jgi:hypothetical protein